jgi:NAD+ synthase (glutamine-hydrolysing)
MKIALAQLNYTIGDFSGNIEKKKAAIENAISANCDLIVFSELSICGYIPKDTLNYDSFILRCNEAINELLPYSNTLGIIIGAPIFSNLKKGKRLRNAALLLHQGKIAKEVYKTLLPTYDIFDEYRYFEPNTQFELVEFKGYKIALTICEDLWNIDATPLYTVTPMEELQKLGPQLMINISGSPYSYNHVDERKALMQQNAATYQLPLIYVNQVGAHTDVIFDGGSLFIDHKGEVVEELDYFKEEIQIINWEPQKEYPVKSPTIHNEDMELIHAAIITGIRDYFTKSGFKKAILGLSGGIDSALVNALAFEALGAENVLSVMMPSKYSSKGSVDDSIDLCKNTGNPYHIISIENTVSAFEKTLEPLFVGLKVDTTEENLQARNRGLFLMALSNKFGHILLNTSNKSESAVGYSTLYGDMCGGLSVIGDLYKTQVYAMSKYINRNGIIIPDAIINKAPSAELRPNQLDSDSLPDYDLLDKLLFHYIENQKGWEEIVALGFEESIVRKIVSMVDRNEYKRFQASPTLRISHKAFGLGRQMPLVAKYFY